MLNLMRTFTLTFLMVFASVISHAQTQHFVYLQTENKQPFYILLNSVTYNSSASGYLIIPKLANDTYNITVGFPKNEFPKQALSFKVDGNDGGYLLKNFGASGWGLFDLNSMKVTMGASSSDPSVKVANNSDDFTKTLSEVVNTDLSTVSKSNPPAAPQNVKKIERQIKLLSNVKDASGRQMIYVAIENNNIDTITVFIPTATQAPAEEFTVAASEPKEKVIVKDKTPEDEISTIINKGEVNENVSSPAKVKMVNSDCKNIANDKDFLRLRKFMAAKSTEDAMVDVAAKEFKKRCYSTDNLKNLSMLFFTDKGRYSFFDTAYPHVYDSDNFSSLKTLLTDDYYILRFEAMIHK